MNTKPRKNGDIGNWLEFNFIEKFTKNLKEVIDSFERAKEWADLSNCL
jgi:molecular chaperone GrpE (heat shock protein)